VRPIQFFVSIFAHALDLPGAHLGLVQMHDDLRRAQLYLEIDTPAQVSTFLDAALAEINAISADASGLAMAAHSQANTTVSVDTMPLKKRLKHAALALQKAQRNLAGEFDSAGSRAKRAEYQDRISKALSHVNQAIASLPLKNQGLPELPVINDELSHLGKKLFF